MSCKIDSKTFETFLSQYASHPVYKAPRGNQLHAKSWQTEAPLRMLLNNLDEEVAAHTGIDDTHKTKVYGWIGANDKIIQHPSIEEWRDRTIAGIQGMEDLERVAAARDRNALAMEALIKAGHGAFVETVMGAFELKLGERDEGPAEEPDQEELI